MVDSTKTDTLYSDRPHMPRILKATFFYISCLNFEREKINWELEVNIPFIALFCCLSGRVSVSMIRSCLSNKVLL